MDSLCAELLTDFLRTNCDNARSIILVGSRALGEAQGDSDLDLIVLANEDEDAKEIMEDIEELQSATITPHIDCKIYTNKTFPAAISGEGHLFLWTALSQGLLLCGEDIRGSFKLNPRLVVDFVWQMLQNLEACRDYLKARSQFTGCCYSVYYALTTVYFIGRFVHQRESFSQPKYKFIQGYLRSTHDIARERYRWVLRQVVAPEVSCSVKIPESVDRKFSQNQYNDILKACQTILELIRYEYSQVNKLLE